MFCCKRTWRQTWPFLVVYNDSKIVLFGGRGNDAHRPHIPSHYNIIEDQGLLEYSTYDINSLISSFDHQSAFCTPDPPNVVLDDMLVLNVHDWAHNYSDNGVCTNGFWRCDPEFYGVDCRNFTCPDSVCQYDNDNIQHCTHCCFYNINERKLPCHVEDTKDMLFTGKSEGICYGLGTSQCAPPYISEACSAASTIAVLMGAALLNSPLPVACAKIDITVS